MTREPFRVGDVVANGDSGKEFRVDTVNGEKDYDVTSLETGHQFHGVRLHNCELVRRVDTPTPTWKHLCPENEGAAILFCLGVDCAYCGLTYEAAKEHASRHAERYGKVLRREMSLDDAIAETERDYLPPPGPSLEAFTDSIHEHLLPMLPRCFSVVTDVCDGTWVCWILDDDGNGIDEFTRNVGWIMNRPRAVEVADAVASELMSRQARGAETRGRKL